MDDIAFLESKIHALAWMYLMLTILWLYLYAKIKNIKELENKLDKLYWDVRTNEERIKASFQEIARLKFK